MSKDEAIKELAQLEPRERQEWKIMEAKRIEADLLYRAWQISHNKLAEVWQPKFDRVQKLKAFLEIA